MYNTIDPAQLSVVLNSGIFSFLLHLTRSSRITSIIVKNCIKRPWGSLKDLSEHTAEAASCFTMYKLKKVSKDQPFVPP